MASIGVWSSAIFQDHCLAVGRVIGPVRRSVSADSTGVQESLVMTKAAGADVHSFQEET
jgi:hypothetical protein